MSHVFFANLDAVSVGSTLVLDGDEGHHAVRVRRIRIGEAVEIVDGHGTRITGEVVSVGSAECAVQVTTVEIEAPEVPIVTVVQALVKKDRSDQVVELLTEAGVDTIIPWAATRSQISAVPTKWERIVQESSKQARRARFPVITQLHSTAEVTSLIESTIAEDSIVLVCHEAAALPIVSAVTHAAQPLRHVVIVIGPEGGLTTEECDQFTDAGARTVVMGRSVMRAATAGAVAASIVSAVTERWGGVKE